jgi:stearoyl-CoA 9-desaturase NADPH oxidoreductase
MFTELVGAASRRGVGRAVARLAPLVDAVATPHGIDRYLELVDPLWSGRERRARIVVVERTTRDSVTLRLSPDARWRGFVAGQHVALGVEIDGVRHTRCYSLAGSQHADGPVELTVKAHPAGAVSRHLHEHAAVGDVVVFGLAEGEFVLPPIRPDHLLLVSGGSGITPVMSMLRTLCDEDHRGEVTFLHYARTAADMIYRDEVAALAAERANVRTVVVLTEEPGRGDLDGLLDREQLDAACPDWATAEAYVCGPAPLMDAMRELYAEVGAAERVHTEAFTLPLFLAEAGGSGCALRFSASGVEVVDDGRTILEQAEGAGLRPAFGCRRGICHTCTRSLEAGAVRNVLTDERSSDPGTPVQLCIHVPVGEFAVDP